MHRYPAALRWSQASAMISSTLPSPATATADVHDREADFLLDHGATQVGTEAACDVCPHPRADHDPIAARFCSATGAGALVRGCVCRH
jgi:hypothetical protein